MLAAAVLPVPVLTTVVAVVAAAAVVVALRQRFAEQAFKAAYVGFGELKKGLHLT